MQVILSEQEWETIGQARQDLAKWSAFLEKSNEPEIRQELIKLLATEETTGNILWDLFNKHIPA